MLFSAELKKLIRYKERKINQMSDEMKEQFRLTYINRLKTHLDLCKDYELLKRNLNMEKHGKTIQLINQFLYGEKGELNWETVRPLLPAGLEEGIKKKYDQLNDNEIRLYCLILYDVDKRDITRILSLKKTSIDTLTSRIRSKTGMKDIQKESPSPQPPPP